MAGQAELNKQYTTYSEALETLNNLNIAVPVLKSDHSGWKLLCMGVEDLSLDQFEVSFSICSITLFTLLLTSIIHLLLGESKKVRSMPG